MQRIGYTGESPTRRRRRAWFNGRMTAFQAVGRGSIPRARSSTHLSTFATLKVQESLLIRPRSLLAAFAVAGFATSLPLAAGAASTPTLKLAAKSLSPIKPAKVVGTHLKAKQVYFLLLAQPDLKHKKFTGLVGGAMTDKSGKLVAKIMAPPSAKCGKATLYAYRPAKSTKMVSLKVTITDCHAKPVIGTPPPPPSGNKP